MSERHAGLEPFEALVGTWKIEAAHPALDAVASGEATFEWAAGGQFLVQRSRNDQELFPDSIGVIGPPEEGEGLVMEYFDSRGVRRTYGIAIEGGELRIWRDAPGFDQRFAAPLGPDAFEGTWQLAETPGEWRDDLRISYRRTPAP